MSEADTHTAALRALAGLRPYCSGCIDILVQPKQGYVRVPVYSYDHEKLSQGTNIGIQELDARLEGVGLFYQGESRSKDFMRKLHMNAGQALVVERVETDGSKVRTLYLPKPRADNVIQLPVDNPGKGPQRRLA